VYSVVLDGIIALGPSLGTKHNCHARWESIASTHAVDCECGFQ